MAQQYLLLQFRQFDLLSLNHSLFLIDLLDEVIELLEIQASSFVLVLLSRVFELLPTTELPVFVMRPLLVLSKIFDVLDELHAIVVQLLNMLLLPDSGVASNDLDEVMRESATFAGSRHERLLIIFETLLEDVLPQSVEEAFFGNSSIAPGRDVIRVLQKSSQLRLDGNELLDRLFSI